MSDAQRMMITISPEPTPEELAAIVAAVTAALREGTRTLPFDAVARRSTSSRWAMQGRREAVRGLDEGERS